MSIHTPDSVLRRTLCRIVCHRTRTLPLPRIPLVSSKTSLRSQSATARGSTAVNPGELPPFENEASSAPTTPNPTLSIALSTLLRRHHPPPGHYTIQQQDGPADSRCQTEPRRGSRNGCFADAGIRSPARYSTGAAGAPMRRSLPLMSL